MPNKIPHHSGKQNNSDFANKNYNNHFAKNRNTEHNSYFNTINRTSIHKTIFKQKPFVTHFTIDQAERLEAPYLIKFHHRPEPSMWKKINQISKIDFWRQLSPNQIKYYFYFQTLRFIGFTIPTTENNALNEQLLSSWLKLYYERPITNTGFLIRERLFNLIIAFPFSSMPYLSASLHRLIIRIYSHLSKSFISPFSSLGKSEDIKINNQKQAVEQIIFMICTLKIATLKNRYPNHLKLYLNILKKDFLPDGSHKSGSFYLLIELFEKLQALIFILKQKKIEVPAVLNSQYLTLKNIFNQFSQGDNFLQIRGLINEKIPQDYIHPYKLSNNNQETIINFSGLIKRKYSHSQLIIDSSGRNEKTDIFTSRQQENHKLNTRELGNVNYYHLNNLAFFGNGLINNINYSFLNSFKTYSHETKKEYVSQNDLIISNKTIFVSLINTDKIVWKRQFYLDSHLNYLEVFDLIESNTAISPYFCVYFSPICQFTPLRSKHNFLISIPSNNQNKVHCEFSIIEGLITEFPIANPLSPTRQSHNSIVICAKEKKKYLSHWSIKLHH